MDNALEVAANTYVDVNIHKAGNEKLTNHLEHLPSSCHESADKLEEMKEIYTRHGVFSERMINGLASQLREFNDLNIRAEVAVRPELMQELVDKYFYS